MDFQLEVLNFQKYKANEGVPGEENDKSTW